MENILISGVLWKLEIFVLLAEQFSFFQKYVLRKFCWMLCGEEENRVEIAF